MKRKKKNKGFTLLEIIAVIVIIGIIIVVGAISTVSYIENSKAKTYESFKADLRVATNNYMIDCMTGNEEGCVLPDKDNDSLVKYDELIDKGYSNHLKDPEGEGYCDQSYVVAKNTSDYGVELEYKVCLYCSKYKSEEYGCSLEAINDKTPPTCDYTKLAGASTEWTKENKEITIGCSDSGSGCTRDTYTLSIGKDGQALEKSKITIRDNAGNTTTCEVDAYVDKALPVCELETSQEAVNGWYKSDVEVILKQYSDEGSSVLAFGMGNSSLNKTYNSNGSYNVLSSQNGTITVFGYVKDKAGNENVCSKDINIDTMSPDVTVYMAYQIYPKENSTKSGSTITINNLNKYGDIKGIIIEFENEVSTSVSGNIYSNSNSIKTSGAVLSGRDEAIYKITEGTYDTLQVDLQNSNIASQVKQIRVLKEELTTSVWTNQSVGVYVEATDATTGIGGYSYDNGSTYVTDNFKEFADNTNGTIIVKDRVGNVSESYSYTINKIDKVKPTLTITNPSNGNWTNQDVTLTLNGSDNASGVAYYSYNGECGSTTSGTTKTNSKTYSINTGKTCEKTVNITVTDQAGNTSDSKSTTIKIDKVPPYTILLDIDATWSEHNVENGTKERILSDVYCIIGNDGTKIYPEAKGGSGKKSLIGKTQGIECFVYKLNTQTAWGVLTLAKTVDKGSGNVDWNNILRRYGGGSYKTGINLHSWSTEGNGTATLSQYNGCTNYYVSIYQFYNKDKVGNVSTNMLTIYSIIYDGSNQSQAESCLLNSTYYFESNKYCKGKACLTYDLYK